MIKFLLISFLIIFLIYKITNFLFKGLFNIIAGGSQQQFRNNQEQKKRYRTRPNGSNVEVEIDPNQQYAGKKDKRRNGGDGEYIEFEEVK